MNIRPLLTFLGIEMEMSKKDFKTNGVGLNVLWELQGRKGKREKA